MTLLEKINQSIGNPIRGLVAALTLIAAATYIGGPGIKQDERKIGLENHVEQTLPQIKKGLEQEFQITLPPTTKIEIIKIPELYPECPDAPALYDPIRDTICFNSELINYPCINPLPRFMGQGNDNGVMEFEIAAKHEFAHALLSYKNKQKGRGYWPNFKGLSEEEILGSEFLGEGFARCLENPKVESDYQNREEPENLSELKRSKNKKIRFVYDGGQKFVDPLRKTIGTQETIDYILDAFPPKHIQDNYDLAP